jgi:NAD(P)-dependent dehydrogenase (short-subunit alcohol dehydrogenase family)
VTIGNYPPMLESVEVRNRLEESTLLRDRVVVVTGAARRIGRALARACAEAGADVVIHFHRSRAEAGQTQRQIEALGRRAWLLQADLEQPEQASSLVRRSSELGPLFGLVNNAAIFRPATLRETSLDEWSRYLAINVTAPYLLSKEFAAGLGAGMEGRIINILDWRARRPDDEHFAYSISKAALAAMTQAMAVALAPSITVNGLALGAILPPEGRTADDDILRRVPAGRWGGLPEVESALLFLLAGPAYVTGEIIHVDGGRHLR